MHSGGRYHIKDPARLASGGRRPNRFRVLGEVCTIAQTGHCGLQRLAMFTKGDTPEQEAEHEEVAKKFQALVRDACEIIMRVQRGDTEEVHWEDGEHSYTLNTRLCELMIVCKSGKHRSVIAGRELSNFLTQFGFTVSLHYHSLYHGAVDSYRGQEFTNVPCGCHIAPEYCTEILSTRAQNRKMWCRGVQEENAIGR